MTTQSYLLPLQKVKEKTAGKSVPARKENEMSIDSNMMPYVQIAAFCQSVLQETNGSLSLIRLMDRYPVIGPGKEMQPTTINLTLVVVLKAGNMEGSATMTVKPQKPDGSAMPPMNVPVLFEGKERGVGLVTQIGLLINEAGLYWFDVLIDEVPLTRIPLRILYQQGQQITIVPPQAT